MTNGKALSGDDHVARHLKSRWIAPDPHSGEIVVTPDAFKPRILTSQSVEREISVNHVEHFGLPTIAANVAALAVRLRHRRKLRQKDGFGIGQVKAIIAAGSAEGASLAICEAPVDGDASHASILGIDLEADLLHAAIARTMTVVPMPALRE